ncbi:MAG: ornithine carbamoyltransferase, partial [Firmicutes bacterium]|nr:ornithine carbamoyltransferase [Bacillota bacterium]
MSVNLVGRSFLTLLDYSKEEILYMLDVSAKLKEKKKAGIKGELLTGKNLVMLFEKTSTRTRSSFEVGMQDEGGHATFLGMADSQFGKKESIEDSAKVLGRIYDGIEFRGFAQKTVEDLAKYSGVPVFNGLTDFDHPTQALADFLTMSEHIDKPYEEMKLVFVGDGRNNVANCLLICAAKLGTDFAILAPEELHTDKELLEMVQGFAQESGAKITVTSDFDEALKDADAIYTDIWCSMGEEHLIEERVALLSPYKVTMDMLNKTGNPDVIFLHCLPSFHDMETGFARKVMDEFGLDICEVTDEVFRSKNSVVFDESENRLHTIKAVLVTHL